MTDFFDLRATHNPNRWYLPLEPGLCVGPPGRLFMFGGIGLASAIAAMERTTGRDALWATAQYLSYARPPSVLDLDVVVPVAGKYNSQARVTGHVGDAEIVTVNAALGSRPGDISHQWSHAPAAPPPLECEPMPRFNRDEADLHSRLETRVVKGRYGAARRSGGLSPDGQAVLWVRPSPAVAIDRGMLAVIADFVPSGIGHALGRDAGGNSLDNTIRFRCVVPTEWVLCDIRIHAIHGGVCHGRMHLFAEDGTLMATASQSLIVRFFEGRE